VTTAQLIARQNQLLEEQVRLLRELQSAQQLVVTGMPEPVPTPAGKMMSEHDLLLIVMADDVLAAVNRWNKSLKH